MTYTFEGRPIDLGDILLRQRDGRSDREKVRVRQFEQYDDNEGHRAATYILRLTQHPWTEYHATFAEIEQTCIREPSNVDRRAKGQRGRRDYDD